MRKTKINEIGTGIGPFLINNSNSHNNNNADIKKIIFGNFDASVVAIFLNGAEIFCSELADIINSGKIKKMASRK